MYHNGETLTKDHHFRDHIDHSVPIQVYWQDTHQDIGFIDEFSEKFVRIHRMIYMREHFTFISRPGY